MDDPQDLQWLALVSALPHRVDTQALQALYLVQHHPTNRSSPSETVFALRPHKTLSTLNQRWRRRFRVGKPDLTWLVGDVNTLPESPHPVIRAAQKLMPSAWIHEVMDLHDRMPNSRSEATAQKALQDTLNTTMQLYNHVNRQVLDNLNERLPPLAAMLSTAAVSDDDCCAWAAGFLAGCETARAAWSRAGHRVNALSGTFGRLQALAARAPLREGQKPMLSDSGNPLLQEVTDSLDAHTELGTVLAELWPTVVQARMKSR